MIPVFAVAIAVLILIFSDRSWIPIREDQENIYGDSSEENTDFEKLSIETIKEGSGQETEPGDELTVHYTGTFKDGTQFDSSYDRGESFTFILGIGEVIDGWDEGLVGMQVGEMRKLEIPSSSGYGEIGSGVVPANAGLIFEVELISIN